MTMKLAIMLAVAFLAGGQPSVEDLAWLSGSWATEQEGKWTEEHWSSPRGGVMLGTGLSGAGDKAKSHEFMRIAADESGTISFWGMPNDERPVPFRLVSASEDEAVFENPAHDYPKRIAYKRSGDRLVATVSGADGQGAQSWSYSRR